MVCFFNILTQWTSIVIVSENGPFLYLAVTIGTVVVATYACKSNMEDHSWKLPWCHDNGTVQKGHCSKLFPQRSNSSITSHNDYVCMLICCNASSNRHLIKHRNGSFNLQTHIYTEKNRLMPEVYSGLSVKNLTCIREIPGAF